jgi:hypothetical protein
MDNKRGRNHFERKDFYKEKVIVKIAYHCFSCDKDFGDIEAAEGHSKSLCHEVNEKIQRAGNDGKSLLI